MLSLFESMHVSPTISCFLQWESMISEIICSLLYRCLIDQQLDSFGSYKLSSFLLSLGILLLSSVGIGIIITFCGIIIMKRLLPYFQSISYGEVIFFLSLGIIAYLVAEGFHLSGTIAIRVSGLILSYSMKYFFSDNAYPFVNQCLNIFLIAIVCLRKRLYTFLDRQQEYFHFILLAFFLI